MERPIIPLDIESYTDSIEELCSASPMNLKKLPQKTGTIPTILRLVVHGRSAVAQSTVRPSS